MLHDVRRTSVEENFKNSIRKKIQLNERDHEDRASERERKNRTFVENFIKKDKWFGDKDKIRTVDKDSSKVVSEIE